MKSSQAGEGGEEMRVLLDWAKKGEEELAKR